MTHGGEVWFEGFKRVDRFATAYVIAKGTPIVGGLPRHTLPILA